MYTTKTTVLADDPARAREEFEHWVCHETVVLLVLLGSGMEVETTVADADKMANTLDGLAHVLWARDPEVLTAQFAALKGTPAQLKQLKGSRGFGLSLTDKVVDVIRGNEPVPDLTRLLEVFTMAVKEAGLGE